MKRKTLWVEHEAHTIFSKVCGIILAHLQPSRLELTCLNPFKKRRDALIREHAATCTVQYVAKCNLPEIIAVELEGSSLEADTHGIAFDCVKDGRKDSLVNEVPGLIGLPSKRGQI